MVSYPKIAPCQKTVYNPDIMEDKCRGGCNGWSERLVCVIFSYIYKQLFDTWNHSDWWFLLVVVFWLSVYWLLFFELGLVFLGWRFFVSDFRATVRLSATDRYY